MTHTIAAIACSGGVGLGLWRKVSDLKRVGAQLLHLDHVFVIMIMFVIVFLMTFAVHHATTFNTTTFNTTWYITSTSLGDF